MATFDCEDFFARHLFNKNVDPANVSKNGFDINQTHFRFLREAEKALTAKAILEVDADVLVLQEVEKLDVPKRFVSWSRWIHPIARTAPAARLDRFRRGSAARDVHFVDVT